MQLHEDYVKTKYDLLDSEMAVFERRPLPVSDNVKLAYGRKHVIDRYKEFFNTKKSDSERLAEAYRFKEDLEKFKLALLSPPKITFNSTHSVVICAARLLDEVNHFILASEEEKLIVEAAGVTHGQDQAPPFVPSVKAALPDPDYAKAIRVAKAYLNLTDSSVRKLTEMVEAIIADAKMSKAYEEVAAENKLLKESVAQKEELLKEAAKQCASAKAALEGARLKASKEPQSSNLKQEAPASHVSDDDGQEGVVESQTTTSGQPDEPLEEKAIKSNDAVEEAVPKNLQAGPSSTGKEPPRRARRL